MLPDTYYRLDYIIFSGLQKIDTGTDLAISHEHYKFKFYPTASGEKYIFNHNKYPQPYSGVSFMSSNKLTYSVAYQVTVNVGNYSAMNTWYEIEYTAHSVSSSTFVVNGDSYDYTFSSRNVDSVGVNCSIGNSYSGYLEYFDIYDQDTQIRKFVPAMRKLDSVVGMYDEINDVFYTNAGTGTFSYGHILYSVSATVSPENSGTVSGTGNYPSGTSVTLTATPASKYEFVKWSNDSTDNPYVFTISADTSLTANFKRSANCRIKVNGVWKYGTVYIKANGMWKEVAIKVKNGTWKDAT